jgi:uncharacterized protein|tara:strand:- start:131 stop:334 length:204 start_codon:yes stop_codon:yes gene_type:complete
MDEIVSPCISVCKFDPVTGYCLGCWRTKNEKFSWRDASREVRIEVIEELHKRREAAGGNKRRTPRIQ